MADQQFQYIKLPDGSYGKFLASTPDAVIKSTIMQQFPNAFGQAAPAEQPDNSSVLGGILNRGKQAAQSTLALFGKPQGAAEWIASLGGSSGLAGYRILKGLGQSEVTAAQQAKAQYQAGDIGHAGVTALSMLDPLATPSVTNINALQAQGQGQEATGQGITDAALLGLPFLAKGVNAVLPSTLKAAAGAKFATVSKAVGDMPVDANAPSQAIFRAQELQDAGRTMPRVMQKFIQRVTDPQQGPLTYDEARDFSSAAGELSAAETSRITPAMKMQLVLFRNALEKNISDTAATADLQDVYQAARKQYALGSNIQKAGKFAVTKLAPGAASAYATTQVLKSILPNQH